MTVKTARPKRPPPLSLDDFAPLTSLPQLVLGIEIDRRAIGEGEPSLRFAPNRDWKHIAHDTAGPTRYLVGLIQTPTLRGAAEIALITQQWARVGTPTRLSQFCTYRERLLEAGLDCNESWRSFSAGFYPIDLSCLSRISNSAPNVAHLDDLVIWESSYQRAAGAATRWGLWILGDHIRSES